MVVGYASLLITSFLGENRVSWKDVADVFYFRVVLLPYLLLLPNVFLCPPRYIHKRLMCACKMHRGHSNFLASTHPQQASLDAFLLIMNLRRRPPSPMSTKFCPALLYPVFRYYSYSRITGLFRANSAGHSNFFSIS
jgi:hypothetical protein